METFLKLYNVFSRKTVLTELGTFLEWWNIKKNLNVPSEILIFRQALLMRGGALQSLITMPCPSSCSVAAFKLPIIEEYTGMCEGVSLCLIVRGS